ncbi:phage tail sheath C-terminal domain-containing protein [Mucilaginibacter sp. cycad4]|uniref:phage tail sheath family protein n=1 Tax=Mucilaginibacter sp. cycad4 TaxID=3342096 RepID=UPI002AAB7385|nr:phage tail sheath C-terminal domain-containing protein [Mucilaginibacter gossypii]WPV01742.1 phage tail sheath C-terminal domain-containing protein [Mucilaginibacter gossypii]
MPVSNYATPGVYIDEISTLPPSIVQGSTAIPAFLGYTKVVPKNSDTDDIVPIRISSMLEYKQIFGGPDQTRFNVTIKDNAEKPVATVVEPRHKLYYALDLFFKNGGSFCYILSLGSHTAEKEKIRFEDGIKALAKEEEPTLIVLSEACSLGTVDYYSLCSTALDHCKKFKNRFCIIDVLKKVDGGEAADVVFRSAIGANNLKSGAAYYPFLKTSLSYVVEDTDVTVIDTRTAIPLTDAVIAANKKLDLAEKAKNDAEAAVTIAEKAEKEAKTKTAQAITKEQAAIESLNAATASEATAKQKAAAASDDEKEALNELAKTATVKKDAAAAAAKKATAEKQAALDVSSKLEKATIDQTVISNSATAVWNTAMQVREQLVNKETNLDSFKARDSALYSKIKLELNDLKFRVELPPSPAIAGVYATVDNERGVWKAPANVSLNAVIGPLEKITAEAQQDLNVDTTSGKSINAIRSFTGRGTIVWGARTLAGNDNEWRYVSVRRLFNMIEDSAAKATFFAVFEPNDSGTWLKVKSMIESFLYNLWQQGALAGSTPKSSYFVNVGLGSTMSTQDILEGRMIIDIGIAAVRPAEFIVLRFSHKLQEA